MQLGIFLWCVLALLATAAAAVCFAPHRVATPLIYAMTATISGILCAAAFLGLGADDPAVLRLPLGLPWVGANFHIDGLSSLFLLIVNLGAAGASLYAIGYGRHEASPQRVLPFFPAFLAGMNLVVLAGDAFTFLLSWEFMSLTSWALVMAHHRVEDNVRAGYVYILMASFGTFALLLAFGLLAGPDGHYGFEAIRTNPISASHATLVLFLVLAGAGSKAGLVPLHVWLPLAHPAAPSHVSALMSGVMTKVAIYAFIRIVFDLLGPPVWWWGIVVLALGGVTALMGVLYALFQNDLKRVLAYSTIENIGFIFVGLGLALAFRADGFQTAAILALTAALFHAFNHSIFKSLLFFGSGAVLTSTGERDMEKLGGLIHRMPVTAFAVLVGCAAISALPPLNGFASEWLTFQAILLSPELPQWGLKLIVPAVGALLALSVALAAACFVRFFGIVFLSRPRSPAAAGAHETDRFSRGVMLALALVCLLVGILPGVIVDAMAPAVQSMLGGHMPQQSSVAWLSLVPISKVRSSYNGLLVFLFMTVSATFAVSVIHRLASKAVRRAPPWDCGFPDASPLIQYSAGSFSQPIRRVFGTLLFRAREQVEMPPPGDMRPAKLAVRLEDLVWAVLYVPLAESIRVVTDRLNVLQFLTIRRYLSLVFAALVLLLLVVAIWR
ncbi:MAG TPA: hydrogenase 4 subunit B [Rhizomicrobium sp.]|nr:hydrogenase 4 subunit B [Rhizomicrobium sp.]